MKFIPIFLILSSSIFPQVTFYKSNNSGMLLEVIESQDVSNEEFYIKVDDNPEGKILREEFFDNGSLVWSKDKLYGLSPLLPLKVTKIEGDIKEVSNYNDDGLLLDFYSYKDNELEFKDVSLYNDNGFIESVTRFNASDEEIYKDKFYRGPKGELRSVVRNSEEGFSNHWFYSNGAIIESWFIEENSKSRTNYSQEGDILSVTSFIDNAINYYEEYEYDEDRVLSSVIKSFGDNKEERFYNKNGYVSVLKIKVNDILVRSHSYAYSDDTLISEKITGHGKIEEYSYTLDSNGDVILISYYIDRELKSNTIIEDDDKEIKEFFRNGVIYLREYYQDKELMEKELFIDGILFKSEKVNE